MSSEVSGIRAVCVAAAEKQGLASRPSPCPDTAALVLILDPAGSRRFLPCSPLCEEDLRLAGIPKSVVSRS